MDTDYTQGVLPGAGCGQCGRPVRQQQLAAGQRHGDKREGQQVVVPVQLRKRVHEARQSELSLPRVVVERNLRSVGPKVHTSPRVAEGQGLFAGRHVEAHEQLAHRVDVENIGQISKTSGFTELALTWREKKDFLNHTTTRWCLKTGQRTNSLPSWRPEIKNEHLPTSLFYQLNLISKPEKPHKMAGWFML